MAEKVYITTSIAYVNGPPHIGHALEIIQADVAARYWRSKVGDENVFFLTGTDEHGQKIYRTAIENSKFQNPNDKQIPNSKIQIVKQFVDQNAKKYRELTKVLNISNDDFIRTSDQEIHWPGAKKMWQALVAAGDIYKKSYQGYYCVGHEAFLREKELIDGKCPDHQKELELIKEENYFFRLSKYQQQIIDCLANKKLVLEPEPRLHEMRNFVKDGLDDISFSRSQDKLPWGIPVPGDPDQIMYVWCDALTNYLTAIGYGRDENQFNKWWNDQTKIIHFVGKDILRFHAVIWPGMLLSAGLRLPDTIFAHGHITVEGQKMSKSLGNVIDPFDLVEGFSVDATRYFLLREISSGGDGDFSRDRFKDRYDADLANNLGNLIQRTIVMAQKYGVSTLRPIGEGWPLETPNPNPNLQIFDYDKVEEHINRFQFDQALAHLWSIFDRLNQFVDQQKPWDLAKVGDEQKLESVLTTIIAHLWLTSDRLAWFLPETAENIQKQLQERKAEAIFPKKN